MFDGCQLPLHFQQGTVCNTNQSREGWKSWCVTNKLSRCNNFKWVLISEFLRNIRRGVLLKNGSLYSTDSKCRWEMLKNNISITFFQPSRMLFDSALQKRANVYREHGGWRETLAKSWPITTSLLFCCNGSTEQQQFCVGTEGENRTVRKILTNFLLDFSMYSSLAT